MIRWLALFFALGCLGGGGGGGGSGVTGHVYSPTGLGTADTDWQNLFGNLSGNVTGGYTGTGVSVPLIAQGIANMNPLNAYGSPYLSNITNAYANAGANMGTEATQAQNTANIMESAGANDLANQGALTGAGQSVWNTALDPQNALYNQTLAQVTDQSRANTSAAGLGMSPYAAGIENQADSDFNVNWQNQQLQRQLSGLQGLSTSDVQGAQTGAAGTQNMIGAQAMSQEVPGLLEGSATTPYQGAMSAAQGPINEANAFSSAMGSDVWGPVSALMGQIIPYMNMGTGAQMNSFNAGQAGLGNLIGLGGLASNMYGMGPGGGYGAVGGIGSGLSNLFSGLFGGSGAGAGALWDTSGIGDAALALG